MNVTEQVKKILSNYDGEPTSIKSKLYQILMHGKLAGTGKLIILPVDQGFEHGPVRSFAVNQQSYDPDYFFNLSIEAGLNAYAAPLGLLQASSHKFAGQIPTILKLNSNTSITSSKEEPDQAITASVKDAIELGCLGVGFTIYPGSTKSHQMLEEAAEIIRKAREYGLISIIWSYARGGNMTPEGETAIDTCAYAAHMAALLGGHIIKVKLPTAKIFNSLAKNIYINEEINISSLADRVKHIVQSCFSGKRLVVFTGGPVKDAADILAEIAAIKHGGGSGSIIGRNSFQRPKEQALELLNRACQIYSL